jgi:hypothetical protein
MASYGREDEEEEDFSLNSMIVLRSLQCWPLLCVFCSHSCSPTLLTAAQLHEPLSHTQTYPTVLTIVHFDGTFILSLYNMSPTLKVERSILDETRFSEGLRTARRASQASGRGRLKQRPRPNAFGSQNRSTWP